eukprot:gene43252-54398_t
MPGAVDRATSPPPFVVLAPGGVYPPGIGMVGSPQLAAAPPPPPPSPVPVPGPASPLPPPHSPHGAPLV